MSINDDNRSPPTLHKAHSGIPGFDEISGGGLPFGRTSLVCGSAGAGKTLFGMQFLVRGIIDYDEPGVFIAFEETEEDLAQNVSSLGFDLQELVDSNKLALDHIRVERSEIEESGEYNLDGLFLRLEIAIQSVGAKRVVIDTLETLFGSLKDYAILRSELRRLFRWLKDQGVSAIITAERGDGTLTRHGLEEYVSDCVILLDHRVKDQISTRRLRIIKYRGSSHGTNEYPFLIDESGVVVMPITAASLDHQVSNERVTTGVPRLDAMFGGSGYFRGSTVLVSGTAGAGKSSLSAHFADATCKRGERCLYFTFEESPAQVKRNMTSIGLNLADHETAGLLKFVAARPTTYGLETHLAIMHKLISEFKPTAVIVDPVSNLISAANRDEANQMVVRLVDYLKMHGITALLTSLTSGGSAEEATEITISSIVDTWLLVKSLDVNGERNRGLYVLKSRGMDHSNQIREFVITSNGIDLVDVYIGPEGVLTGSARAQQENREQAAQILRKQEIERRRGELDRKRRALEYQIEALRAGFETEEADIKRDIAERQAVEDQLQADRKILASRRRADQDEQVAEKL